MASLPLNTPEFSVSELSRALKRTIEDAFGQVRLRGEISGFKRHSSGHLYFSLKDADAAIDAVMWKGVAGRLAFRPEDGLEVVAIGRLSTYPRSSRYQIVVERMEVAGVGALLAQIEERRKRLATEGLFAPERKKRRPFLPTHIGVITSPTGAVIRDIMHRLSDRFPRRVTLWPVPVQGEAAAGCITAAIHGFNALPPERRPDLLIVARGGGSVEDLMAFNAEEVVRAVAASGIPVISAVGHETDTTLIDHAADVRAPTPTAAAELAVPVRVELVDFLADLGLRAGRAERRARQIKGERMMALAARLPRPAMLVGLPRQQLDDMGDRLARSLRASAAAHRARLKATGDRLQTRLLTHRVERERARLHAPRVSPNPALLLARVREGRQTLAASLRLIESLSPEAVLKRGFALVTDDKGRLVKQAGILSAGAHIRLRFGDGQVGATVDKGERGGGDTGGAAKPAPAAPKPPQGQLF